MLIASPIVQFFCQKKDGIGRPGLSTLQKCTTAIRVLAYGFVLDAVDEYLRFGATTAQLCVENFVEAIINLFGDECVRRPTLADLQRLLHIGELCGIPGMIGASIVCIGSGRIVPPLGKGNILVVRENPQSF